IVFFLHLFLSTIPKTPLRVVELLLLYQLFFNIGILGLLSFFGLTFMPEHVANHLQWPACPFQQELGNANLAFATLGILSIWIRGHFWTATVIGTAIWLFADGVHHLLDAVIYHNFSEGNTGLLLYSDLLIPILSVILLCLYLNLSKKKKKR